MKLISQRGVIGTFYKALTAALGAIWVNDLSNYFESDQDIETYAWLGQSPTMREWAGGRNAKGLKENGIEVKNLHFESTIDILLKHLRRDKTGQAMVRIKELAKRANTHWASLLSTLILGGATGLCYDGQYYFDTDHEEGKSGAQSNSLTIDISALPVINAGSITAPSVEEMQLCIIQAIGAIIGFLDDQGEPMNEDATKFTVMVPVSLMFAAKTAIKTIGQVAASQTALDAFDDFEIKVAVNPRLSSWTTQFGVFRTDSNVKSFIRQEETLPELKIKDETSEYAFDNDACEYGIDAWRNVAYGYWQNACLVTMG
ncbi:MAG: Mu-like prophage major head subunit gpT family protein [Desulfobacterales bacterium]|nr:Mu-like prophage major head subunit gpT family protein [Desulfobacterales bacterium]